MTLSADKVESDDVVFMIGPLRAAPALNDEQIAVDVAKEEVDILDKRLEYLAMVNNESKEAGLKRCKMDDKGISLDDQCEEQQDRALKAARQLKRIDTDELKKMDTNKDEQIFEMLKFETEKMAKDASNIQDPSTTWQVVAGYLASSSTDAPAPTSEPANLPFVESFQADCDEQSESQAWNM